MWKADTPLLHCWMERISSRGLYGVTSIVLEIADIKADDLNMTEEKMVAIILI